MLPAVVRDVTQHHMLRVLRACVSCLGNSPSSFRASVSDSPTCMAVSHAQTIRQTLICRSVFFGNDDLSHCLAYSATDKLLARATRIC